MTFSVDEQEEAIPLQFPQPEVCILVNTCKLQTELVVKYKYMHLQFLMSPEKESKGEKYL